MFGFQYYPTPPEVIEQLIDGLVIRGKVCYDPSAGGGRIVRRLHEEGASSVLATEIDKDLRAILAHEKCVLLGEDFFKIESHQVSHVDFIVMNPPFSDAAQHILHAWKIAPPGCKIRALCNVETFKNSYTKSREELKELVDGYGLWNDIGNCFATSERKTDVHVALLRLDKPGQTNSEFEGFFLEDEQEEKTGAGLMPYNEIRDIVNRYVESMKIFDEQLATAVRLSEMTAGVYGGELGMQVTRNGAPLARNEFKKGMQKAGWMYIFSKLNMKKHATKGLKEDINNFVEKQQYIPFTMRNIYKMLEIVIGTTEARMDKAIIEVFDRVTSYHDDNKYGLEGWKTNSHYLLTRRFIMPSMVSVAWGGGIEGRTCSSNFEMVQDLQKALCFIAGQNYDEQTDLEKFLDNHYWLMKDGKHIQGSYGPVCARSSDQYDIQASRERNPGSEIVHNDLQWGQWFDWEFFKIRCYKKGTVHFEFKDEKVWAAFNQRVAKIKGYPLAEKKAQSAYQNRQHGRKPKEEARAARAQAPAVKPVILGTFKINKAA